MVPGGEDDRPGRVKRSRAVRRAIWGALALGGLAVVFLFAAGVNTTRQDRFCQNCHEIKPAFRTAALDTKHADVPCVRCHTQPGVFGWVQSAVQDAEWLVKSVTDTGKEPLTAVVPNENCLSCHRAEKMKMRVSDDVRSEHPMESIAKGTRCVLCHRVGHTSAAAAEPRILMGECFYCHDGKRESARCTLCHTRPIGGKAPATHYLAYPHPEGWQEIHGTPPAPGEKTCANCHGPQPCQRCHTATLPHPADYAARPHVTDASAGQVQCAKCHEASFCETCHAGHPSTFPPAHTLLPDTPPRAQPPPRALPALGACSTCHAPATCTRCHQLTEPEDCLSCHRRESDAVAVPGGHETKQCLKCHTPPPHEAPPGPKHFDVPACSNCHDDEREGDPHTVGADDTATAARRFEP